LFQKRIYSIFLGTLVGKRKQTIFKKRWFDITTADPDPYQNLMDPQHCWMSAYLSTRTNTGLWKL
jgi:hypothetical protein